MWFTTAGFSLQSPVRLTPSRRVKRSLNALKPGADFSSLVMYVSSFGRPVCSVAEWVPHSVVFAFGVDFMCVPLTDVGVGLGPSPFGPVSYMLKTCRGLYYIPPPTPR